MDNGTEKEENPLPEDQQEAPEEETAEALTAHLRRLSRGRVVELPRWAS